MSKSIKKNYDVKKLHYFFNQLFKPTDYIALSCFAEPRGNKAPAFNKVLKLQELIELVDEKFIQTQMKAGRNICVSPNPIKKGKRRGNNSLGRISVAYIDIDKTRKGFKISEVTPKPDMVSEHEGKYHLFWLLRGDIKPTPANLKKFDKLERGLIAKYGADPAVKDPARAMRCPYTPYLKTPRGTMYKIILHNKGISKRSLTDLQAGLQAGISPNVSEKIPAAANDVSPNVSEKKLGAEKTGIEINEDFIVDFILDKFAKQGAINQGDGRSLQLFFAGLDCHGWGLDLSTAIKVALTVNKQVCKPPESRADVEHQVKSAYRYSKSGFGEYKEALNGAEHIKEHHKQIKQHRERHRIRAVLRNHVYVLSAERLINITTNEESTTQTQVTNHLINVCASRISLADILQHKLILTCSRQDFCPDDNRRVFRDSNGLLVYNRFRGLAVKPVETKSEKARRAIKIFTNHIDFLTTTPQESAAVLNFFAYILQNPGKKVMYALLFISREHGLGKSLLERLFRNMLKAPGGVGSKAGYVGSVDNRQLGRGYTHYLAERLFVFVHEIAQGNKKAVPNQLKALITEMYIEIDGKYAKPYEIRNAANFIMSTNEANAILLDKHDRRYLVIHNRKSPMPAEYYDTLIEMMDNDAEVIYSYLLERNLSDFNPYKRPEMTEGKKELIEQSLSELDLYLLNLMEEQRGTFEHEIFTAFDLLNYVEMWGGTSTKKFTSLKSIKTFLDDNGFVSEPVQCRVNGKRVNRVYFSKVTKDGNRLLELKKSGEFKKVLADLIGEEQSKSFTTFK